MRREVAGADTQERERPRRRVAVVEGDGAVLAARAPELHHRRVQQPFPRQRPVGDAEDVRPAGLLEAIAARLLLVDPAGRQARRPRSAHRAPGCRRRPSDRERRIRARAARPAGTRDRGPPSGRAAPSRQRNRTSRLLGRGRCAGASSGMPARRRSMGVPNRGRLHPGGVAGRARRNDECVSRSLCDGGK